jgi:hypothetical protein
VIQGTVTTRFGQLTQNVVAAAVWGSVQAERGRGFRGKGSSRYNHHLITALGEVRLRQLRAEGAARDEVQACRFARTQINEYLAGKSRPMEVAGTRARRRQRATGPPMTKSARRSVDSPDGLTGS